MSSTKTDSQYPTVGTANNYGGDATIASPSGGGTYPEGQNNAGDTRIIVPDGRGQ